MRCDCGTGDLFNIAAERIKWRVGVVTTMIDATDRQAPPKVYASSALPAASSPANGSKAPGDDFIRALQCWPL